MDRFEYLNNNIRSKHIENSKPAKPSKKNVKPNKFKSSFNKPIVTAKIYKIIHIISENNNKLKKLDELKKKINIDNQNNITQKFNQSCIWQTNRYIHIYILFLLYKSSFTINKLLFFFFF